MDTTVATKAYTAKTPDWGTWVTHYDTAGQMPTVEPWFGVDNTVVSLIFDKMEISLQGPDKNKLAASIGLAGHYPIALPDGFNLRGFILAAHGFVWKSPQSSAILTLSIGDSARTVEWPRHTKVIDVSDPPQPVENDKEFDYWVECFVGDGHPLTGNPPVYLPIAPVTVTIGMHARRRSTEEDLIFTLDGLEIILVDLKEQTDRASYRRARSPRSARSGSR